MAVVDHEIKIAILSKAIAHSYRYMVVQGLQDEKRQKESERFDRLLGALKKHVETAADVRTAIRSGQNELLILAVLVTVDLEEKATREARLRGERLYLDAFSPATKEDLATGARIDIAVGSEMRTEPVRPHIAQESMHLLKLVGENVPLFSDRFDELVRNLRCDDLVRDLDYFLYLFDRRRAVLLTALGALVGASGDAMLAANAKALAQFLERLPSGTNVFSREYAAQLSAQVGFELPVA